MNKRNNEFTKAFGNHLRKLRMVKGLSIRELALEADIEFKRIYLIEHGQVNPTIVTVQTLAEALGLSHQDLFDFKFPTPKYPSKRG